jgi:hypothetical protein
MTAPREQTDSALAAAPEIGPAPPLSPEAREQLRAILAGCLTAHARRRRRCLTVNSPPRRRP